MVVVSVLVVGVVGGTAVEVVGFRLDVLLLVGVGGRLDVVAAVGFNEDVVV